MSEWTVRKAAGHLWPGQRFIFAEDIGGEGEVLTVVAIAETLGTTSIETEELDFDVEVPSKHWVTIAGRVEEDDEPPGMSRIEEEHDYKFGEWRL